MNAGGERIEERLASLSKAYGEALSERVGQIEALYRTITRTGWRSEQYEELKRLVHSLKGSGRTFGFPEISESASGLEELLDAVGLHGGGLDSPDWLKCEDRIAGLKAAVGRADLGKHSRRT